MATKYSKAETRTLLEKELRVRVPLPEPVWANLDWVLVERVAEGADGERRAALRELVDQARADLADYISPFVDVAGGAMRGGGQSLSDVDRPAVGTNQHTLGDYEMKCGRVYSEGIGRLAGDPAGEDGQAVAAFRRAALGGRALTVEEAFAFVQSPAVAALSVKDFARIGASPAEHRARIEDWASGVEDGDWGVREFARFTVVVEPPGARVPCSFWWSITHRKNARGEIELPVEYAAESLRLEPVVYWDLGIPTVLSDLHVLAKQLAKHYPWKEWQAAWFVLTGQPTWIAPLTTRTEVRAGDGWSRGTVTMTVDLWVPAATVERIYRHIQNQRRTGAARRTGAHRLDKALAVWLFSEDLERAAGRRLTTPELMRAWNDAHPDHRRADRSSFHDLRKRGEGAAARILAPGFAMFVAAEGTTRAETTPIATPKPADADG